jgi:hypothetical protein
MMEIYTAKGEKLEEILEVNKKIVLWLISCALFSPQNPGSKLKKKKKFWKQQIAEQG